MPYHCCVPKCRSNFDGEPTTSVFGFPKDKEQRDKWLQSIKRKGFVPTKTSKVCEVHFKKEEVEHSTKFYTSTGDVLDVPLNIPRLKKDAIPSIFSGYPKYFAKEFNTRESPESKKKRLEYDFIRQAVEESMETSAIYDQEQKLNTLNDVLGKFIPKTNLETWTYIKSQNFVSFMTILELPKPTVTYLLTIDIIINLRVYFKETELKTIHVDSKQLKLPVKVISCNFLESVLIQLSKKKDPEHNSLKDSLKEKIEIATSSLDSLIELLPERRISLNFIKEQLCHLENHERRKAIRYSYETLLFCSLFLAISPHAYKFVRNYEILILPCTSTVAKICNNSLTDPRREQTEEGFLQYIKLKVPLLSPKDMIINLMADEIHLKPFMDMKGGNFVGGAYNSNERATSACTFMINSLTSSYKDVVHVAPVKTLSAIDLHSFQKRIIYGLESLGFEVLVATTDNHRVNRKAISAFANPPALKNEYTHPSDEQRSLFFTVDTVHLLKNIRNNLISKEPYEFVYPDFENFEIRRTVAFNTIREMQKREENQLLKYGYTISKKALYSTSMEKQNVKLVLQVFNRTTVVALRELGPKISLEHYEDTAIFVEIICNWWDIMNVKTYFKGIRYRNKFQEPMRKDSIHIFKFLNRFLLWLDEWKKYDSRKLTNDTHTALRLTTEGIIKIAHYCYEKKNLTYILPGKIQNDNIEDRFGKYRCFAGSQYLISVRQLFEVEKKLRLMNLVPLIVKSQSGKLQINKEDISSFISYEGKSQITNVEIDPVLNEGSVLEEGELDQIPERIWPSLVYIAGYASFSLLRHINCDYCKEFLINSEESLVTSDYPMSLIAATDRGGLSYPKDDVVLCAAFSYLTAEKLLQKESLFLRQQNHREILTNLSLQNIDGSDLHLFLGHKCQKHETHYLIQQILFKFANLLLKNYTKKKNDVITSKVIMPQLKRIKPCES